jgi:pilus assembly protein Flp/PilA
MSPSSSTDDTSRCRDDRGASLVEYALLLALIALVCVAAVAFVGGSTGTNLSTSGTRISSAFGN